MNHVVRTGYTRVPHEVALSVFYRVQRWYSPSAKIELTENPIYLGEYKVRLLIREVSGNANRNFTFDLEQVGKTFQWECFGAVPNGSQESQNFRMLVKRAFALE